MLEVNKSRAYECSAGTLLYHHWQDAHYNVKGKGYVQGFHVELDAGFFQQYGLPAAPAEGSSRLDDPLIKTLFRKLYFFHWKALHFWGDRSGLILFAHLGYHWL